MGHHGPLAWVFVIVLCGALVTGCSASETEPTEEPVESSARDQLRATEQAPATERPPATEPASDPLGDVLAEVDWPDDEASVAALLGEPTSSEAVGAPPGGLYDLGGHVVSATGSTDVWLDYNRAGVLLLQSVIGALGPNNCVDAQYSPVFADYFALGEDVPPGRDEQLWNSLQDEVARVGTSQVPEGLLWLQCTQVFDDYTGPGMLHEGQRRYVVAWSDGEWVYSLREYTAAARADTVEALVAAAKQ